MRPINALLSRRLGEKNFEAANKVAENGIFVTVLSWAVFAVFGAACSGLFMGAPGKTNGHGCGHHLLGTAAVAAVDALKTYMESHGLLGTIRYYGCPAEENAGGKAYLVRDGFFNDCDASPS